MCNLLYVNHTSKSQTHVNKKSCGPWLAAPAATRPSPPPLLSMSSLGVPTASRLPVLCLVSHMCACHQTLGLFRRIIKLPLSQPGHVPNHHSCPLPAIKGLKPGQPVPLVGWSCMLNALKVGDFYATSIHALATIVPVTLANWQSLKSKVSVPSNVSISERGHSWGNSAPEDVGDSHRCPSLYLPGTLLCHPPQESWWSRATLGMVLEGLQCIPRQRL